MTFSIRFYTFLSGFALCIVLLTSCGQSQLDSRISDLEVRQAENPDSDQAKALIDLYDEYITSNPNSDLTPKYIYRCAQQNYTINQFARANELVKQQLLEYPKADISPYSASLLALLSKDRVGQPLMAGGIVPAAFEKYGDHKALAPVKEYVTNPNESIDKIISEVEGRLNDDSLKRINKAAAVRYIALNEGASYIFADDNNRAGEYVYKAARTANATGNFYKALDLYKRLTDQYQNHPKAPQALFQQAFIQEQAFRNSSEAKKLYTTFLERYPNDEFADDAKFSLENIDRPMDEVFDELMRKADSLGLNKKQPQ